MQTSGKENGRSRLLGQLVMTVTVAVLCLSVLFAWLLLRDPSLAWFASNKRTESSGMQIGAKNERLVFEDTITVVPGVGDITYNPLQYLRGSDGVYREVTKDASGGGGEAGTIDGETYYYVLDSDGGRVPLRLTGLFPGEELRVTVRFRVTGDAPIAYRLSLSDFDDTNGRFTVGEGEGNTPGTYSLLGIFRARLLSMGATGTAPTYTAGAMSGQYLASYDTAAGTTVPTADPFTVVTGVAAPENGVISCTFGIGVHLGDPDTGTQYYALRGTTTNMLSKKQLRIGSLTLAEDETAGGGA